ncbi:MAG: hypothetical protein N3A58_01870 [Spirochaetes bacterium]|nr:hypothetical protein [Spirochaetota bacterium]
MNLVFNIIIYTIYNLIYLILFPFILMIYLFNNNLRFNIFQRFGFLNLIKEKNSKRKKSEKHLNNILIHCSSAGEANLGFSFFGEGFIYSVFNKAGYDYLKNKKCIVYPLPFDFFIFILVFLKKLKIKKLVLIEQEVWPTLLISAYLLKIKVYIFNGIIYNRSYKQQRLIKFLYSLLFNISDKIFVQSEKDFERFLNLGTKKEKLEITGNLKLFFNNLKFSLDEKKEKISKFMKPIIIFSSFHNDEFNIIKDIYNLYKSDFLFIIAPRFFNELGKLNILFEEKNLIYLSSYTFNKCNNINENELIHILRNLENNNILIIDKIGYLREFYKFTYLAIIGGSFNNKGGQNFIEPIAYFNYCIIGPSYYNFESVFEIFKDKTLIKVENEKELINFIYELRNLNLNEISTKLIESQNLILNYSERFKNLKKIICE